MPRPHPSLREGEGLVKNGNIPGPEAGIWESQSDRSICNYRIPHDQRARCVSISPALACIIEAKIEKKKSFPIQKVEKAIYREICAHAWV